MTTSLVELGTRDMQLTNGIYHLDTAVIKGSQPSSKKCQLFQFSWIDVETM